MRAARVPTMAETFRIEAALSPGIGFLRPILASTIEDPLGLEQKRTPLA
jgi:hypothetical protein